MIYFSFLVRYSYVFGIGYNIMISIFFIPISVLQIVCFNLPHHPIYRDKVKINRPIIFKVASLFDKHTIMTRLKMLKDYNQRQHKSCSTAPISKHLPKEMYEQKKLLMPHFKHARKMKLKTKWMEQNRDYCHFVDNRKVNLM